jgi:hypothetical protein
MTTPTPIEEVKISDKILHINCDKDLSEEAIKYINKMVEIAYNMSEEELKSLNEWTDIRVALPEKNTKVRYKMIDGKIDIGIYDGKDFRTLDPVSEEEITHWKLSN